MLCQNSWLDVIVNTLTQLTCVVGVCFCVLLTRLGATIVTVLFLLVVLSVFYRLEKKKSELHVL